VDTIYALSTAPGRAGIAMLRVSGPQATDVARRLTGKILPAPREAALTKLVDPVTGVLLDKALLIWFAAPHSFTGEDIAEFMCMAGGRSWMVCLGRLLESRGFVSRNLANLRVAPFLTASLI